jgi:hypothetical protein
MPKITYRDHEKAAPVVTWFGVEFKDGEAVDLDKQKQLTQEQKDEMLMRAETSPFYEVEGAAKTDPAPGTPTWPESADYKDGHEAAEEGAKRDAKKSTDWLKGFDAAMAELEEQAAKSKNTHPRR